MTDHCHDSRVGNAGNKFYRENVGKWRDED